MGAADDHHADHQRADPGSGRRSSCRAAAFKRVTGCPRRTTAAAPLGPLPRPLLPPSGVPRGRVGRPDLPALPARPSAEDGSGTVPDHPLSVPWKRFLEAPGRGPQTGAVGETATPGGTMTADPSSTLRVRTDVGPVPVGRRVPVSSALRTARPRAGRSGSGRRGRRPRGRTTARDSCRARRRPAGQHPGVPGPRRLTALGRRLPLAQRLDPGRRRAPARSCAGCTAAASPTGPGRWPPLTARRSPRRASWSSR